MAKIVEQVVGVEAGFQASDLDQPRPDRLGWGVDRDRSRALVLDPGHKVVTGH